MIHGPLPAESERKPTLMDALRDVPAEYMLTPPQQEALGHRLVHEAADLLGRVLGDPEDRLLGYQDYVEESVGQWLGMWLRDVPVLEWPDYLPCLRPPGEAPGIDPDVLWSLRTDQNGREPEPCAYALTTVCGLPAFASWYTDTPEDAAEKFCGRHQFACPAVCPVCTVDLFALDEPLLHTNPAGALCVFYWTPAPE